MPANSSSIPSAIKSSLFMFLNSFHTFFNVVQSTSFLCSLSSAKLKDGNKKAPC
nr:MAG TPA: hypothetical protein [Caudoviricetes sp.]